MKKEYQKFLKICSTLCIALTLAIGALAQVTHQVTVQNFQFSPADLVINEGDIVQWTNIGGFHNVNGTTVTFPVNSESFGNDPGAAGWTYSYTFTTVGENAYRCDIHPGSMVGSVTVVAAPVTHQVTVQNFEFTPANLVINEGDIVQWTNIDGFHNVNGTFATYPDNMESFGNNPAGPGWTYSHQFTTAGVNNYHCDIHPGSMMASVTVIGSFDCPALEANIGDSCDDNNANTDNDMVTADCECVGTVVFDCPILEANIGDSCDDNNANTENDVVTADCACEGTPVDTACINTTQFPNGMIDLNSEDLVFISGCIWFGDVSTMTGINAGYEYEFAGEVEGSGDLAYITVRTGSADGPVIGMGFSPLTVTAPSSANLFVHWNNGTDCLSGTECIPATGICLTCGTQNMAEFNGSLNWNSSCADRDVVVNFYTPNTATLVASYPTVVNSAGDFSIPDVEKGTYDVIVNVPGYLNQGLADVETVAGQNAEDFGTIIGGDVNNNNVINILDISLANNAFNTAVGNPNYILFADVNCNGNINILDISAINFGFALGGATAPLP